MRITPRLLLTLLGVVTLASVASAASVASFADLGNNTYSYTRESSSTFARDIDQLVAEAKDDATRFCAARGKQPKFISIAVDKPWMTLGFPKATVQFKALDAGDPALADTTPVPVLRTGTLTRRAKQVEPPTPVAPATSTAGVPAVAPSPAVAATPAPASQVDDLYNGLLKLDDLRKRGLLTDEEFQVEKKKLLDRSK